MNDVPKKKTLARPPPPPPPGGGPPAGKPDPLAALRSGVTLPDRVQAALGKSRERLRKYEVFGHELDALPMLETYRQLEKCLKLDEKRADPDALEEALDQAPNNFKKASYLAAIARAELESYRLSMESARWHWEREARKQLGKLKDAKEFSGQVTEALIERWMLSNLPEYMEARQTEEDLRKHCHALEAFAKSWDAKSRSIGLQAKVSLHRRGVPFEALFGGKSKTPRDGEDAD